MPTIGTLTVALEADVEALKKGLNSAAALVGQAARRTHREKAEFW